MTAAKAIGPIKGVIKHRDTDKYYMGFGQWSEDVTDAMEFTSLTDLMEETERYEIRDCCEFVITVNGRPDFSVYLPL
ncbi:MAG TPA: hypothetical protein VHH88_13095 [Verrucomicrobiae bacterium]|nr:hypothetical protein [Verrucomicrobiae bacterium]